MKRIISLVLTVVIVLLTLVGCGNMSVGPGNYNYQIVHVFDTAGNYHDYHIEKWYNDESGIEVTLTDGNNLFLSEGTYILAKDYCPLCDK